MKSKQLFISGKVQGVGFRIYSLKAANELGITGWARNISNSDVEILAHYKDEATLERFVEVLKKGPARSKVDNIEIIDVDSESDLDTLNRRDTFTIEPDGE